MRRRPVRIWVLLLADLVKLGVLTTTALVLVLAFAVSVRFLAEGKIDLAGAVRLTALGIVPMLQYALPFAAGFAATLVYHRFAADREATASMACGISHASLLAPAGLSALVLGGVLVYASNQVIPHFLRSMEVIVKQDLTGFLARSVDRGESVRLGDLELFAEEAVRAGPDSAVGATERLRLRRVLAASLDADGAVQGYLNADAVNVWLFDEEHAGQRVTTAQLVFRGAAGEGMGDAFRTGMAASQRIRIPAAFSEDPKFLTFGQLAALRHRPEGINFIETLRRGLALKLVEESAAEAVGAALAQSGRDELARLGDERLVIIGSGLTPDGPRGWAIGPSAWVGGRVRVERTLPGGGRVALLAERGWISSAREQDLSEPGRALFELRLEGVSSAGEDALGGRDEVVLGGVLGPANEQNEDLSKLGVFELLQRARAGRATSAGAEPPASAGLARTLERRTASLAREVLSKQHERAAYAIASVLTLLCGAVSALRRETSMPLPVYLWSFFPAFASVITISAGQGLTHSAGPIGLLLLWGGVAALGLYVAREFAALSKH